MMLLNPCRFDLKHGDVIDAARGASAPALQPLPMERLERRNRRIDRVVQGGDRIVRREF